MRPPPALPPDLNPSRTGPALALKQILNRYHGAPASRATLRQKVLGLEQILHMRPKLERSLIVDRDAMQVFMAHVTIRRDFYRTLLFYETGVEDVDDLMRYVLCQSLEANQGKVKGARDLIREAPNPSGRTSRSGDVGQAGPIGLHWDKIIERLDPYHRDRLGGRDSGLRFAMWATGKDGWDDRLKPSQNLVDFLLSGALTRSNDGRVGYFDAQSRRFSKLVFHPGKSVVYAYYVRILDEKGNVTYDRCTAAELKKGRIPHQRSFHTIASTAGVVDVDGDTNVKFGALSRRQGEGLDMFGSQIYVLSGNVMYSYKASGAKHSMALQGQAVDSAGMIVADRGKILAIDNKSGHYRPSWKHLEKAVEFIARSNAFAPSAFVGVSHGEGCVFLTVKDFRTLARKGLPMSETVDAINRGYEHVFKNPTFAKIRRAYEQSTDGEAVWSWSEAKKQFLELLYPKAQKYMRGLEALGTRHRTWYAGEFKQASRVKFTLTRGGLGKIDQVLARFDRAHREYLRVWYEAEAKSKVKDFNSAVTEVDEALKDLDLAVEAWSEKHGERAKEKRSAAVKKLQAQMEKDRQSIDAVKDWVEDMAKRDAARGYLAQWS